MKRWLVIPEIAANVFAGFFALCMVPFTASAMWLHKKRTGRTGNPYEGF